MKILIADDDHFSRRVLEAHLQKQNHLVVSCSSGEEALKVFQRDGSIDLVVLDWMMPGMSGLEVCREIKKDVLRPFVYVIILTTKCAASDLATALESGADDFVSKPFDPVEFEARLKVGQRTMRLQTAMLHQIRELEEAASRIERLNKMIPICPGCGKSRNDRRFWDGVREYVREHSHAELSDALCESCNAERAASEEEANVPVVRRS
jgi:phosphoserine phosphatase RsbU/P